MLLACLKGRVRPEWDTHPCGPCEPPWLILALGLLCRRRFPLEEIPQDEREAAQWLHKLYQEKVTMGASLGLGPRAGLGEATHELPKLDTETLPPQKQRAPHTSGPLLFSSLFLNI